MPTIEELDALLQSAESEHDAAMLDEQRQNEDENDDFLLDDQRLGFVAYARQAARQQGINPRLFVRQIDQESGFDPDARSSAGARGIAQIMPVYHPEAAADDPYASIDYAARLMRQYLDTFDGDYSKALAAYNAGAGAVQRYNGVPPFEETQRYVKSILGDGLGRPEDFGPAEYPPDETGGGPKPPASLGADLGGGFGAGSEDTLAAARNAAGVAHSGISYDAMSRIEKAGFLRFYSDLDRLAIQSTGKSYRMLDPEERQRIDAQAKAQNLQPVINPADDPVAQRKAMRDEARAYGATIRARSEARVDAYRVALEEARQQRLEESRAYAAGQLGESRAYAAGQLGESRAYAAGQRLAGQKEVAAIARYNAGYEAGSVDDQGFLAGLAEAGVNSDLAQQLLGKQKERLLLERSVVQKKEAQQRARDFERVLAVQPAPLRAEAMPRAEPEPAISWDRVLGAFPLESQQLTSAWQDGGDGLTAVNPLQLRRMMAVLPITSDPRTFLSVLQRSWAGSSQRGQRLGRAMIPRIPALPQSLGLLPPRFPARIRPGRLALAEPPAEVPEEVPALP